MSKPNLLNDLAFKFVFGQDTKEANQALKGILEVFLNQKIHKVQVKNHFQYRLEDGYPLCSEKDPCRIIFIEMPKVDFNKPLNEMNTKERLIYYFTHCQDKDAIGG